MTLEDLLRVAERYLRKENESIGVITSSTQRPVLEKLGLQIKEL